MKTTIFLVSVLFSVATLASDYKLNDPEILGEYVLRPVSKTSELQRAEIRYNADKKLVVILDRNDSEFELDGPTKDNVVYEGEDEPNCDGEEPSCYYDLNTKIVLEEGKDGVPRLQVEITVDDAWDETGKSAETSTYILVWKRELPNAIPFYTNVENPSELNKVVRDCQRAVKPTVGYGIGNAAEICTNPDTVKFRDDLDDALPYFLDDMGSAKKTKRINKTYLNKILETVEEQIMALDGRRLKVEKAELVKQSRTVGEYIAKGDQFYYYQFAYMAVVYRVDLERKLITTFMLRNKR